MSAFDAANIVDFPGLYQVRTALLPDPFMLQIVAHEQLQIFQKHPAMPAKAMPQAQRFVVVEMFS